MNNKLKAGIFLVSIFFISGLIYSEVSSQGYMYPSPNNENYEYPSPYDYQYPTPGYSYQYEYPSPYGYQYQYEYQYPTPYGYPTPSYNYEYEYQYQSPSYPSPENYTYPTPYGYPSPSGGGMPPGSYPCGSDSDCRPNPGGVATCCNAGSSVPYPGNGSSMCASTGGGPYCYNYEYQTPVVYSYQYQTPVSGYSYQYEYQYPTPTYATPATGAPFGSISATSCVIALGSSTCNSSVTWSTANLTSNPTAVTRNNPNNTQVSTATSGTNVSNAVNFGISTFYLYHNSVALAYSPISATCAAGSAWNGTICAASTASCDWDPNWSPWSACINGDQSRTRVCPCGSGCSGSYIETRSCSSTCTTPAITASPETISSGGESVLSWCSPGSSCTATSSLPDSSWTGAIGGSGSVTVSPTYTTTYILTCGTQSATATVIVRNKPWFVED